MEKRDGCILAENRTQEIFEPPCSPTRNSRTGRLWQKVKEKYSLVDFHSCPDYLRDNEYILAYYRADWPLKQTLLSMFTIHNETLNIWTHLVGFVLFLCLTIYTATRLPTVVSLPSMPSLPHMADLQRLPAELIAALSSSLPNLHLPDVLTNCIPDGLHLHIPETLSNCLPERLLSTNRTEQCVLKPITRWPFFIFLGGAMFCLFTSSTCHLLSCHSERVAYIMLRLDYAGIAALIAASFYPPVYYTFMCNPILRNIYLISITSIGIATILVSLFPVFQKPEYRMFRAALFFGMGVFGVAPVMHKVILHYDEPAALYTTAYEVAMGIFYGLGALVYAARIPERWKPGKFDIAGHSHQLFHILVVAGAYTHYQAGLLYLKWRDVKGCQN
eukprot:c26629_g1_i3 orf=463-1626(-)